MREILFKAKHKNWRDLPKEEWWVEGYYCYFMNEHCILPKNLDVDAALFGEQKVFVIIDPETLCQYTGLTDKNGKRIWENDIANIRNSVLAGYGLICYENGCLVIKDRRRKRTYDMFGEWKIRVDGNIFDNPELLE